MYAREYERCKMISGSAEYMGKWLSNNVAQCWTCKNCVGQQRAFYAHNTKSVDLPECKVADCYMTYVIRVPCGCYEHDSRKALNLFYKEDNNAKVH